MRADCSARIISLGVALGLLAGSASAQLDRWKLLQIDATAFRIDPVAVLPLSPSGGIDMVYGDTYGVLRIVNINEGRTVETWRSRQLGDAVLEVLVEDMEGDGRAEIIARTRSSLVYVYDDRYEERWVSSPAEYRNITAMAIANVDADPAFELVLLAQNILHYLDGVDFQREYQSTQAFNAQRIVIGNVDGDAAMEIVTDNGQVIDAETTEVEWQAEPFGTFIQLLDIDGDGLDEILGFSPRREMRIFDADERQEKPLR